MKHWFLLLILLFLSNSVVVKAQPDLISYELQLDHYDITTLTWFNMTLNNNGYTISSNDEKYDGLSSDEVFFDWNGFDKEAIDDEFFSLNINDPNPNYILTFQKFEQSNTIAINQIPQTIVEATGWIKMLLMGVEIEEKILSRDFDELIWPISTQIFVLESYPEQYQVSVLFQRGNDNLESLLGQNISLFAGVDIDFNDLEFWMNNATYSMSIFVDEFTSGKGKVVSFPSFTLRSGTQEQISSYPIERINILVMTDTGIAILNSFEEGFNDFIYKSDIIEASKMIHEYKPWNEEYDGSDDLTVTNELGNYSSIIFIVISLGIPVILNKNK